MRIILFILMCFCTAPALPKAVNHLTIKKTSITLSAALQIAQAAVAKQAVDAFAEILKKSTSN